MSLQAHPPGHPPGNLWAALAALLALGAMAAWWLPTALLDWQPGLATNEPWRAWSAALVHWSPMHLAANLLGAAVVAALGPAARLPARAAWAWALAWPLTQAGLCVQPALAHYGGLSGVLHAGVAVAALWLVVRDAGRRRNIGAALLAGLAVKVVMEEPWGPPLHHGGGWDIATAPIAHATGAVAGLLCAAAALALRPAAVAPAPPAAQ